MKRTYKVKTSRKGSCHQYVESRFSKAVLRQCTRCEQPARPTEDSYRKRSRSNPCRAGPLTLFYPYYGVVSVAYQCCRFSNFDSWYSSHLIELSTINRTHINQGMKKRPKEIDHDMIIADDFKRVNRHDDSTRYFSQRTELGTRSRSLHSISPIKWWQALIAVI